MASFIHLNNVIIETSDKQIFIATHNDLISARLDLRKTILLNSNSTTPMQLKDIPKETANYFMKAPDNYILQFILSKKVILVEGDAEYILMEAMFRKVTSEELNQSNVHVIAVGGTRFKRYLDLAKILPIKTAVITDNDENIEKNITHKYKDYKNSEYTNINIFTDMDESRRTFEICLYYDNQIICDKLFAIGRKTISAQDFMLANKADCAFTILEKHANDINVPQYIIDAIQWIRE